MAKKKSGRKESDSIASATPVNWRIPDDLLRFYRHAAECETRTVNGQIIVALREWAATHATKYPPRLPGTSGAPVPIPSRQKPQPPAIAVQELVDSEDGWEGSSPEILKGVR